MQPPPSSEDNINAGPLLAEKRFSEIFRGFQGVSQFLYGFSSKTADWERQGQAQ